MCTEYICGHSAYANGVIMRSKYEPQHDKTNSDCAPSEDSDQPGHPPESDQSHH